LLFSKKVQHEFLYWVFQECHAAQFSIAMRIRHQTGEFAYFEILGSKNIFLVKI
jgi:hypothetical protein